MGAGACRQPRYFWRAFQAFAAEALGEGHFFFVGAFLFRAGGLQGGGEALEAGLGEEGGEAAFAHLAFADVGVAVAAGAEGGGGVVDVDGAEALDADLGVGFVEDLRRGGPRR